MFIKSIPSLHLSKKPYFTLYSKYNRVRSIIYYKQKKMYKIPSTMKDINFEQKTYIQRMTSYKFYYSFH